MLVLAVAMFALLVAVLPVVWFARRRAGYSHVRQTISELGEAGARDEKRIAIFAFAPAGHAIWLFVAALAFSVPQLADGPGLWLFALLGLSYVAAAMFPCDPGAPMIGSWRNNLHNTFAGIGYLGAAAGMIELGRSMEDIAALAPVAEVSRLAGQVSIFGVFALSFPSPVRGLVQRALEGVFHGWMVLIGILLVVSA